MNTISNEIKTAVLIQAMPYIQRYTNKIIVINYGGNIDEKRGNMEGLMGDIVLLSAINVRVVVVHEEMPELAGIIKNVGGKAVSVLEADKELVENLLNLGYIPVVAAPEKDADTISARLAGELKAENIIAATNVKGVLREQGDESTLISELSISDVPLLTKQGVIQGGMLEKVASCALAIRRGVKKAFIINGCTPHSILIELFSDEGIGTMIV